MQKPKIAPLWLHFLNSGWRLIPSLSVAMETKKLKVTWSESPFFGSRSCRNKQVRPGRFCPRTGGQSDYFFDPWSTRHREWPWIGYWKLAVKILIPTREELFRTKIKVRLWYSKWHAKTYLTHREYQGVLRAYCKIGVHIALESDWKL